MSTSIEQHNHEIHENAEAWKKKPLLRKIYLKFYKEIQAELNGNLKGLNVELGSGMGNVKEVIPDCITTDLFPNPWLDQVENAYALTFDDNSVANLILFDVWHHLQFPGTAMKEFARVLKPGGRVILFEPAMGALGKLVYGLFHHEPLGLKLPIELFAPPDFDSAKQTYYAAQGNCWRLFRDGVVPSRLKGWRVQNTQFLSAISYVGSGGFSGPQLYPGSILPAVEALDDLLSHLPLLFATRMLVSLEQTKND